MWGEEYKIIEKSRKLFLKRKVKGREQTVKFGIYLCYFENSWDFRFLEADPSVARDAWAIMFGAFPIFYSARGPNTLRPKQVQAMPQVDASFMVSFPCQQV